MNDLSFSDFLTKRTSGFTPAIDAAYKPEAYVHIDLSGKNPELSEEALSSSENFSTFIKGFLRKREKEVAFGGYNEVRKLYRRSDLFTSSEDEETNRNIHLGVDIWADAGTAVMAVLDGKIHSFRDNANFGDYGPTVILEHDFEDQVFYTLYGHLSRQSLENLLPGQQVRQGEKIGALGCAEENGDYAPHLHFQVMRRLEGREGDYPGVSSRKDLNHFLNNCPDPNLLLKIPG